MVTEAFLKQMELHRLRLKKVREHIQTDEDKTKAIERFIGWLNTTSLTPTTRKMYLSDLNFILNADDEAVLWACSTTQNTRTVLKHLVEIIENQKKARRK